MNPITTNKLLNTLIPTASATVIYSREAVEAQEPLAVNADFEDSAKRLKQIFSLLKCVYN
jgi:hypothetical protein